MKKAEWEQVCEDIDDIIESIDVNDPRKEEEGNAWEWIQDILKNGVDSTIKNFRDSLKETYNRG